jgi:hypothetical protein
VSFSEPSLLAADHQGRRVPLAGLLAEPSSERCQHALGRVAVLKAGEDHPVLRRVDFGTHARHHPTIKSLFPPR